MRVLVSAYQFVLKGLVAVIVAIVLIAVFYRYVLNAPLIFSFDLATILFVWLVFLGLTQAAHEGSHMALDLFTAMLAPGPARALDIAVRLLMIAIAVFLVRYSLELALRTRMEVASMRISKIWVYMAVPVGFTILAAYESWSLVRLLQRRPLERNGA